jgi:rifampicin phosphotransferase
MPNRGSTTCSPWVVPLESLGRNDWERAGGKGASLGELLRAGFAVPPGFVVTTAAYDLFLDSAALAEHIAESLRVNPDDDASSRAIRSAFMAAEIPSEVKGAVSAAYRRLAPPGTQDSPNVAVAVRSSATAEDLPGATFAGQQDTYLNVIGLAGVLDALLRCWASLWTSRAIAYRRQAGVEHAAVKQAVVVQRMVFADVAGALLTANPITGLRDELVIDASPGLGEAVVSGLVTPDHYEVDKRSLKITRWVPGRGEVVVRGLPRGGTQQAAASPAPGQPALPEPVVRSLARMGTAIERHFRVPQDVEWAWAGEQLYVLQARPITALPAPRKPGRRQRWVSAMMAELFPTRPYPLDVSSYTATLLRIVADAMARPLGLAFPPPDELFVEEDAVVVALEGKGPRPTWRTLFMPWVTFWRTRHVDAARWEDDPMLAEAQRTARELERRDLQALDWAGVLRTVREALAIGPLVAELRRRYAPPVVRDLLLLWLVVTLAGRRRQLGVLLSGVETKTLELNRAIEALAGRVRADPAVRECFATTETSDLLDALARVPSAGPFLEAFEEFLDCYGHRETVVTLASQPTWKDAPEVPLGVIKSLAAGHPGSRSSGSSAWEAARDDILKRSFLGRAPLRRHVLRLLERARLAPRLREDTHFYFTLAQPTVRRSFLELGRRLASVGALDQPMDIFHLRLAEIEAIGVPWPPSPDGMEGVRAIVARRRAKRESLEGRPLVDPRMVALPAPEPAGGALLVGSPGSPGVAAGPVRVVRDPSEFGALRLGEVLVAPYTNPAWTPLFPRAAAVIVDSGGPLSHAAIVAREYGIPAVMGAANATRTLADGQRIRVDGTRGVVWPDDTPHKTAS